LLQSSAVLAHKSLSMVHQSNLSLWHFNEIKSYDYCMLLTLYFLFKRTTKMEILYQEHEPYTT